MDVIRVFTPKGSAQHGHFQPHLWDYEVRREGITCRKFGFLPTEEIPGYLVAMWALVDQQSHIYTSTELKLGGLKAPHTRRFRAMLPDTNSWVVVSPEEIYAHNPALGQNELNKILDEMRAKTRVGELRDEDIVSEFTEKVVQRRKQKIELPKDILDKVQDILTTAGIEEERTRRVREAAEGLRGELKGVKKINDLTPPFSLRAPRGHRVECSRLSKMLWTPTEFLRGITAKVDLKVSEGVVECLEGMTSLCSSTGKVFLDPKEKGKSGWGIRLEPVSDTTVKWCYFHRDIRKNKRVYSQWVFVARETG